MSERAQAGRTVSSDDKMIVNLNLEELRGLHNLARHLDVGARRLWIPRRVIVDEDDGCGRNLQSPANNLARVDGRVVDRAMGHKFVAKEPVAFIEEQGAELFTGLLG